MHYPLFVILVKFLQERRAWFMVIATLLSAHPSVDWERWVWPMSGGVTRGVWHWPQGRVSSNYRIVVSAVEL